MTVPAIKLRFAALAAATAVLMLLPATTWAHAELLEMVPDDGATVEGAPAEISATFSEPLLTEGSTFSIRNASGERLAVGQIDPDDPARLVIDPVPDLAPGVYEIRWQAATADGHLKRDTWSFTVTAAAPTRAPTPVPTGSSSAGPTDEPGPTPEPSPSAAQSPSASPTPTDPTGATDTDVILPILAGLAIVLIGAGLLLSRRGRPANGA